MFLASYYAKIYFYIIVNLAFVYSEIKLYKAKKVLYWVILNNILAHISLKNID